MSYILYYIILCLIKIPLVRKRGRQQKGVRQNIIKKPKRIHFTKLVNGVVPDNYKSSCNFDCFYYCYKIGLSKDIIWLD